VIFFKTYLKKKNEKGCFTKVLSIIKKNINLANLIKTKDTLKYIQDATV